MLITLKDLKLLLECEEKAHSMAKVGYAGADLTAQELIHALNEKASVSVEAVEAALFSFDELQRDGKTKHPDGITRNQWAKRMCPPGLTFDEDLGIYHTKY
jgi:hypothetical protein